FKTYRGMGSLGAMMSGSGDRYRQATANGGKLVPEGVEGRGPHKGHPGPFIFQLGGGPPARTGDFGAPDIEDLRPRAQFILVTGASVQESHPHDIAITQEAPNYSSRADYAASDGG